MAVTLVKGQKINLEKEAGGALATVRMGLGWDVARPGGVLGRMFGGAPDAIDLDASCGMFDAQGALVDLVWFAQLRSRDGSIRHTGDNLTGAGEGDDESILVDLERVPAGVRSLVFTVNSYRGQSFDTVANAFCRLLDHRTGREIARYGPGRAGPPHGHGDGQAVPARGRVEDARHRRDRRGTHLPGHPPRHPALGLSPRCAR